MWDDDPRAIYFTQAKNGMFVRMALIISVLEGRLGAPEAADRHDKERC